MAPRLIQDQLENFSGRCWPRSPREIVFSGSLQSFKKKNYQIGSIGDRSGKLWLGSSGISNFWSSIVIGVTTYFVFGSFFARLCSRVEFIFCLPCSFPVTLSFLSGLLPFYFTMYITKNENTLQL